MTTTTTNTYLIHNEASGHVFGIYFGETAEEAIKALRREACWSEDDNGDLRAIDLDAIAWVSLDNGRTFNFVSDLGDEEVATVLTNIEAFANHDSELYDACEQSHNILAGTSADKRTNLMLIGHFYNHDFVIG